MDIIVRNGIVYSVDKHTYAPISQVANAEIAYSMNGEYVIITRDQEPMVKFGFANGQPMIVVCDIPDNFQCDFAFVNLYLQQFRFIKHELFDADCDEVIVMNEYYENKKKFLTCINVTRKLIYRAVYITNNKPIEESYATVNKFMSFDPRKVIYVDGCGRERMLIFNKL